VLNSPRPGYPAQSIVQNHVGAGIFILTLRPDGTVSNVTVAKSIGYAELDESGVKAFSQWRFKPGVAKHVEIPLRFVMQHPYVHAGYDIVYYPKGVSTSKPSPSPARSPRR
jgi:TonB family protein